MGAFRKNKWPTGGRRNYLWVTGKAKHFIGALLLFLFAITTPAQAAIQTVPSVGSYTLYYYGGTYSTAAAGCNAWFAIVGSEYGPLIIDPANDMNGAYCSARHIRDGFSISGTATYIATCPSVASGEVSYTLDPGGLTCSRHVCPVNSSGTFPDACRCNAGYEPDPTKTHCVSKCTVTTALSALDPALQPYEDGLIDMENETQATRDGAACIVRAARARHLRPRITSGYRPTAYQKHIREVYDKWQLLKNNNDAACADTKRKVSIEFDHHSKFAHQPGNASPHSSGRAVDISLWNYADADTIAEGCNMSRSVPNDRVHFESPR